MSAYSMDKARKKVYDLELKRANIVVGSGGGSNTIWGAITGDITQQKDLQNELSSIKESIPVPYNDTQVKTDIESLKLDKADKSDTYTKLEVDNKITDSGSVDLTAYYTKEEIEGKAYLTTETDPTVPDWAKQPNKPTYTANEVGALPDTTKIPDITGLATKTELTEGLATKADILSLDGLATKKEIESKANSADVYTKEEIGSKLGNIDTILDSINGEIV